MHRSHAQQRERWASTCEEWPPRKEGQVPESLQRLGSHHLSIAQQPLFKTNSGYYLETEKKKIKRGLSPQGVLHHVLIKVELIGNTQNQGW